MGTNYYAVDIDPCLACGRADGPLHICKSFHTFAGHLEYGEGEPTARFPTWSAWRAWLLEHRPIIEDEYGEEMPLADFIRRCDEVADPERVVARRREGRAQGWWREGDDWIDPAGYRFCGGEFS